MKSYLKQRQYIKDSIEYFLREKHLPKIHIKAKNLDNSVVPISCKSHVHKGEDRTLERNAVRRLAGNGGNMLILKDRSSRCFDNKPTQVLAGHFLNNLEYESRSKFTDEELENSVNSYSKHNLLVSELGKDALCKLRHGSELARSKNRYHKTRNASFKSSAKNSSPNYHSQVAADLKEANRKSGSNGMYCLFKRLARRSGRNVALPRLNGSSKGNLSLDDKLVLSGEKGLLNERLTTRRHQSVNKNRVQLSKLIKLLNKQLMEDIKYKSQLFSSPVAFLLIC